MVKTETKPKVIGSNKSKAKVKEYSSINSNVLIRTTKYQKI